MLQNMGGAFDFDREAIDKMVQERIAEGCHYRTTRFIAVCKT